MSLWAVLLFPALAAPVLSAFAVRRSAGSTAPGRTLRGTALHLACISLWGVVASLVAVQNAGKAGVDGGTAAGVLLLGMVWVEAIYLLAARSRGRTVAQGAGRVGGVIAERSRSGEASGPASRRAADAADRQTWPERSRSPVGDDRRRHGESNRQGASLPREAEVLLNRILGLTSLPLESIMTARDGIVFVDGSLPADRALKRMAETRRSRIPVMADGSPDRILGVVHAKDLVPLVLEDSRKAPVRNYLRRWLRVPRGQSAAQLLEDFRRNRAHVGIVGDSLGRTQGLVTLGDIFRYIAGPPPVKADEQKDGGRA